MSIPQSQRQPGVNPALPLTTWLEALDRLGLPLLLIDLDGREIHTTPVLRVILLERPVRRWVLAAATQIARAQLDYSQPRNRAGAIPDLREQGPARKIRLAGTLYAFRAALIKVPASVMTPVGEPVALVSVERRNPVCPSVARLAERFRLTRREAEVALLLAQRMHNDEIAESLSISAHTARHHTQRVLEKLNIRQRADVKGTILENTD